MAIKSSLPLPLKPAHWTGRKILNRALCLGLVALTESLLLSSLVFAQDLPPVAPTERDYYQLQGWTPFQLSVFAPLQLYHRNIGVAGLRLNLISGRNIAVRGIDLGLRNESDSFVGFGFGLANVTSDLSGIQIGAINYAGADCSFLQIGLANSCGRNFYGAQLGLLNDNQSQELGSNDFLGIQVGLFNIPLKQLFSSETSGNTEYSGTSLQGAVAGLVNVKRDVSGIAVGGFNSARDVRGLQVGLFNAARSVKGLQLGALNFNEQGALPFTPLINGGW